jgi:hypothetical protein
MSKDAFTRFVNNYTTFGQRSPLRYQRFLQVFTKDLDGALEHLCEVGRHTGGIDDDPAGRLAETRRAILGLATQWAWVNDIAMFKKNVPWQATDSDIFLLPYSTLPTLVRAIAARLPTLGPRHSGRELLGLLLANLLPIYFVKAANIEAMVDLVLECLPDFVTRVCVPTVDYAEKATATGVYDYRTSACRGASCHFNDARGIHFVALDYNPTDELVPEGARQRAAELLAAAPVALRRAFDRGQYHRYLSGEAPILPL